MTARENEVGVYHIKTKWLKDRHNGNRKQEENIYGMYVACTVHVTLCNSHNHHVNLVLTLFYRKENRR